MSFWNILRNWCPGTCRPAQDSPASLSLSLERELALQQACLYCQDRGPPGELTGDRGLRKITREEAAQAARESKPLTDVWTWIYGASCFYFNWDTKSTAVYLVSFIWEVRLNALVQIPPSRLFPLVLGLSWQCLYASKATLLSSGSNPHVDSDPRYIA